MLGEYHDFALLITVEPETRCDEWEAAVRAAEPEEDMSVTIRKPTILVFAVKAEVEFLAQERAIAWVNGIAGGLETPLTITAKAHPTGEIPFEPLPHEDEDDGVEADEPPSGLPELTLDEKVRV